MRARMFRAQNVAVALQRSMVHTESCYVGKAIQHDVRRRYPAAIAAARAGAASTAGAARRMH